MSLIRKVNGGTKVNFCSIKVRSLSSRA